MISRGFIQRLCVVLGLIAVSVYLFYTGKGHVLLLDTNSLTIGGNELRSHASVTVSVDGQKLRTPMGRAERVSVTVSGPGHTIVITDDADAGNKVEKTFTIPLFMRRAIVSIPAIIGGAPEEHWIAPFVPPPPQDTPIEKMHYQDQEN